MKRYCLVIGLFFVLGVRNLVATETENHGLRVLPVASKITIDGKLDDWDLSGGLFACSDVENLKETTSVWLHAMYDTDNFYILARFRDETPLNNPGQTAADYGFNADSLQFRTITAPGTSQERGNHFTCWKGVDGKDVINVEKGTTFKEGVTPDAKTEGARQAFKVDADAKGYVQEIAIPWKLLTRDGKPLKAGNTFRLTFEPNFTVGSRGRLTVKDLFLPGLTPDRVFTFMAPNCWGTATLESRGPVEPLAVRLSDAREFPVRLEKGVPVVDWKGLIKSKELQGFRTIKFTMPEDGTISLIIKNKEGIVVRHLLNAAFFPKGEREVRWDGLTTPSVNRPGEPVPTGDYSWQAIWHKGIGLKLQGWAANSGSAPWDGPSGKDNWGGDHGLPSACAADADQVYLAWNGAEGGKSVLACDLKGNVRWSNIRSGIAGAKGVAAEAGVVYVLGGSAGLHADGGALYKLDARNGSYITWGDSDKADVIVQELWNKDDKGTEKADAIAVRDGILFLSFSKANRVVLLDTKSGKLRKTWTVESPSAVAPAGKGRLYVVSKQTSVLELDTTNGKTTTHVKDLKNISGIAVDKDRRLFVAVGEPDNQIHRFDVEGKPAGSIGRKGGRPMLGKWDSSGLAFVSGIAVDSEGKVWATELDWAPKRISTWDGKTGVFLREFFGPPAYGALGGAISPLDPDVMVGQGCAWRLDPKTGHARCLGTFHRQPMETARFGVGSNGKLYLAVATQWAHQIGPILIYERLGDADYKLRSTIYYVDKNNQDILPPAQLKPGEVIRTAIWCDENGDGVRQANEIHYTAGIVRLNGWYLGMNQDLTFYIPGLRFKVTGFTACGAPRYDLGKPEALPKPDFHPVGALGSVDGRWMLYDGPYGVDHGEFACYDLATGKRKWTYPDNFVGVHGSHNAVPPERGMIRGSFGPCGVAKLPDPIGNVWIIATNVGEWHVLTEQGFYLTRLFQPDPLKVKWPDQALPGASMDNVPCGAGGEDFGGSLAQGKDGKIYLQAGKHAYWNVVVVGLESVKAMPGGTLTIEPKDVVKAQAFRENYLQANVGMRRLAINKRTPTFTGVFEKDFADCQLVSFQKQDDAAVRVAASWDDSLLYLGWDVKDATPWVNGAEASESLYVGGDTVDLQLGLDPKARTDRNEAVLGDLRLSIGNFKGTPTAVLYRPVAKEKHPKVFSSGVIKEYKVDSVLVLSRAKITVKKHDRSYVVEVAIPLKDLGLQPTDGLRLRGDFGVTHGDTAGKRTRLRSYWSNQHTGIVDDAVFELMLEPTNWGNLVFTK